MRDSKLFDEAIERFFRPIAQNLNLRLSKTQEGSYEIASTFFIMRIRLHTGHYRGLNVLLRPTSSGDFDENKPGNGEYGIVNFLLFSGKVWRENCIETDAGFLKEADRFAKASEEYMTPYLLGAGKNFDAINEMVKHRIAAETRNYSFPSNVQKKWIS